MRIEDEDFQKEVARVAEGFNLYLKALADKFNSMTEEERAPWIAILERDMYIYDSPAELGPYTKRLIGKRNE